MVGLLVLVFFCFGFVFVVVCEYFEVGGDGSFFGIVGDDLECVVVC